MHLASDYIHPTVGGTTCRVRIFLDEERLPAAVLVSEVPTNPGRGVSEVIEVVAAEVAEYNAMARTPIFVEHHPPETTDGATETFELVVFAFDDARQIVRDEAEGWRRELGRPVWKPLDRETVEALVGQEV